MMRDGEKKTFNVKKKSTHRPEWNLHFARRPGRNVGNCSEYVDLSHVLTSEF
jgi:hypothetical protein